MERDKRTCSPRSFHSERCRGPGLGAVLGAGGEAGGEHRHYDESPTAHRGEAVCHTRPWLSNLEGLRLRSCRRRTGISQSPPEGAVPPGEPGDLDGKPFLYRSP